MYAEYFGFKELPFELTTDPKFLLYTARHRWAFEHLAEGIKHRKGFIQITGEVGTGKTTMVRAVLGNLGHQINPAYIVNPPKDDNELIEAVATEFGLDTTNFSRQQRLQRINRFLKQENEAGRIAVIIVDEAQNLGNSALEELRQLSNFEANNKKLLQIALIGQPELKTKLEQTDLRQLHQRITIRFHITALTRTETEEYIQHRLEIAGGGGSVFFTNWAFSRIQRASKGIPRAINALCDKALLVAYAKRTRQITWEVVGRAIQELRGEM